MRFTLENRVRAQKDFDSIRSNGVKADCSAFILFMERPEPPREHSRLGVVASRRIGNSVYRHRAKRIFREIFRNTEIPLSCDILVYVRRGMFKFEFADLKNKFERAVKEFCEKAKS
jgi:ribonuclease P protein component